MGPGTALVLQGQLLVLHQSLVVPLLEPWGRRQGVELTHMVPPGPWGGTSAGQPKAGQSARSFTGVRAEAHSLLGRVVYLPRSQPVGLPRVCRLRPPASLCPEHWPGTLNQPSALKVGAHGAWLGADGVPQTSSPAGKSPKSRVPCPVNQVTHLPQDSFPVIGVMRASTLIGWAARPGELKAPY